MGFKQAPVEASATVRLSTVWAVFHGEQGALCSAPEILLFLSSHLLIGHSVCRPVRMPRCCMTPVFPLTESLLSTSLSLPGNGEKKFTSPVNSYCEL